MIRITRETSYADKLRAYKVLVDDEVIGEIRQGQTCEFAISGRHTLHLKVDWCRSRPLEFEADSAKPADFVCRTSLSGWKFFLAMYYVLFKRDDYIELERR